MRKATGLPRNSPAMTDIAHRLNTPGASPIAAAFPPDNSDDAPTIITQNSKIAGQGPVPPPPPYVVGEAPTVNGRRLGHFELIEAVGAGGMAAVLRARDLELGRIVALKILPPEAAHDPENVNRFKQEARAAAKLDHDNVARVYFCGEDQGLHFIAFEFVEGITLRQMLDRRKTIPAGECIRYMIQIAAGLAHAADRQVVHRDIKPSNIIITPEGRAKIVDMGLARHLESQSVNGGVTQSGVTLGTFDYISPEQALDPRLADVRSDIYSLGCTFYHALTGRTPVPEGTAAKKLHAHQHIDPLDPRELNPTIPDELAAVLSRMMVKDASRRYQTPAELIAHLKGAAERLHISVDAAVHDSVVKAVAAEPNVLPSEPRLSAGWIAAGLGVAVAIVALILATSDRGPAPSEIPLRSVRGTERKVDPPILPLPTPPPAIKILDDSNLVRTPLELAEALAKPDTQIVRLAPGVKYDLTKLNKPIRFVGKQIELIGSPEQPPSVILPTGGLTLKAETVVVSGIRFDVLGARDADALGITELLAPDHGLHIADALQVTINDCIFDPDERASRKAATLALSRSAEAPVGVVLRLTRCLFAPSSLGVRVPAQAKVNVFDSGFGPHDTAIQITPHGIFSRAVVRAEVALERSSFMLNPGAAAVGAEGAGVNLTADYCVFAPAGSFALGGLTQGMVIRTDGPEPEYLRLSVSGGMRNAYYRVDPIGTRYRTFSFEECVAQQIPATDKDRSELRQRPWDASLEGVLAPFATENPYRAFRLRSTDLALFTPENKDVHLLGAQFHTANNWLAYDAWPPPTPLPLPTDVREKVWLADANVEEANLPPGHYVSLVKLLEDVRSGDVVLIQATGEVRIKKAIEVQLPSRVTDRSGFKLTFKPATGFNPVLTFDAENRQIDASLFRIIDGEITFENLHFHVKPRRAKGHDSVTAVKVIGSRGCIFTRCLFDLDEDDGKAAAVAFAEPGGEMMMDPPGSRTGPSVAFTDCFLRGRGRGIWVASARPFDARIENTITAIYGPVVQVKSLAKDAPNTNRSILRLNRTTALLGGPLLEMHSGRTPVDVEAAGCLFAAVPFAGMPFIELTEIDPMTVKRSDTSPFRWTAMRSNRYANYEPSSPAMVMRSVDGDSDKEMSWMDWPTFAGEPADSSPVGKVTFKNGPATPRDLGTLSPRDLDLKTVEFADLMSPADADLGADLAKVPQAPASVDE